MCIVMDHERSVAAQASSVRTRRVVNDLAKVSAYWADERLCMTTHIELMPHHCLSAIEWFIDAVPSSICHCQKACT